MYTCLILCIYNIHGPVTCLCVFLSVSACVFLGSWPQREASSSRGYQWFSQPAEWLLDRDRENLSGRGPCVKRNLTKCKETRKSSVHRASGNSAQGNKDALWFSPIIRIATETSSFFERNNNYQKLLLIVFKHAEVVDMTCQSSKDERKLIQVTLNLAWLLVPGRVFQELLIYWDFPHSLKLRYGEEHLWIAVEHWSRWAKEAEEHTLCHVETEAKFGP